MSVIYALSPKGRRERDAARPTLPADLTALLHLCDGRRTQADVLAVSGKNAVTAGGLRWLVNSGYIQPAQAQPALGNQAPNGADAAIPAHALPDAEVSRILSDFLAQTIRRWLGAGGYANQRQIECAQSVGELLPHLYPVIDAIAAKAGADAAAEVADTAAFILDALEREAAAN